MIIVPFLGDGAFDHDMSMALDDVCKTLNLTGGANAARQIIAERIIELARRGERSPTVLRDRVLHECGFGDGQNGCDGKPLETVRLNTAGTGPQGGSNATRARVPSGR